MQPKGVYDPSVSFGRLQLCMQPRYMSWCRKVLTILSWSLWFFMHIYATRSCFLYFLVDLIFFLPRWHRALRFGFSPKDGSVEEQLERPAVGHQIWLWPRLFQSWHGRSFGSGTRNMFFFLFRRSKLQTESLIAVKFTQCLHKKSLGSCPSHNKDATFCRKTVCVYIYSLSVCLCLRSSPARSPSIRLGSADITHYYTLISYNVYSIYI